MAEPGTDMDYRSFFSMLTGGRGPYRYQERLQESLAGGSNVILRAPTGAGKTWAVIAPYLFDRFHTPARQRWADRMIYALPLRSLATDLHATVFAGVLRAVKQMREQGTEIEPPSVCLQIGGQQDDPYFESDLVFTTIDQLLSGYILCPVSLPERAANIPAGAIPGGVVVVDEVHLLEPARSLGTLLEMTQRLDGLTQTVLMSATIPTAVGEHLAKASHSAWIPLGGSEVRELPSHCKRLRTLQWVDRPLTAEDVLAEHLAGGRTAVVVNSVARAQRIFRQLQSALAQQDQPPRLILLHSRFYPDDRREHEQELRAHMGPDATGSNAILVSTQVVEAGLDFSADRLLTELAPMNSLIQRAGRVARYADRNTGRVLVFALETTESEEPRLGPYRDQAAAIEATRELLSGQPPDVNLDFSKEIEWLNAVHQSSDLAALQGLMMTARAEQVAMAMNGNSPSARSQLIRDADSVALLISSRPETLTFTPYRWPQCLNVPRTSLWPLQRFCRETSSANWVLKSVQSAGENDSEQPDAFAWETCSAPQQAGWLAAIHPGFAAYSPEVGLEIGVASGSTDAPIRYIESPFARRHGYRRECWAEHARAVAREAESLLDRLSVLQKRMQAAFPDLDFTGMVRLAALLHDTGKLGVEWQRQAGAWEFQKTGEAVDFPLAHTTFDPASDSRHPLRPRFPPHAVEGAYAVQSVVLDRLPNVDYTRIVLTAIARHHAPFARSLGGFRLIDDAGRRILKLTGPFAELCDAPDRLTCGQFCQCMMDPTDLEIAHLWPVYLSVVRLLRLADQKATARAHTDNADL